MNKAVQKVILFLSTIFLFSGNMYSQCNQLYDGLGVVSASPYWVNCTGGAFTLNLASPNNWTNYTIDWGDGSANDVGASYTANTFIVHNYATATDSFIVTVTTTSPACTMSGVVVMEEPVNASLQIPIGGVTTVCAPGSMSFINSSTDVSPTTVFTWDFGDGSAVQTFGASNAGQTIVHTFQPGTVSCQTAVTLTAENYCSFGTPTSAQFNPVQVYDKDQVSLSPDAPIKCMPSTSFTFTNTTTRNCLAQGNVSQRYERWNFHDYWGLGHDSIIDWGPWPPSTSPTINYPGLGTYQVTLIDSNFCGIDSATTTVIILAAPVAGVAAPVDTACQGATLTFNNTGPSGYTYRWNFGDNATWTTFPYGNVTHTYNTSGTFTVSVAAIVSAGNSSCRDTATVVVTILVPPTAGFTRTPASGCDNITVSFTDASAGAVAWDWASNGTSFSTSQTPANQNYTTGTYTITQTVTSNNGCTASTTQTVSVFASPVAAFSTGPSCQNVFTDFTDASTSSVGDPLTTWAWDFGDGGTSTLQNPSHIYTTAGTFTVTLDVTTANCAGTTTVAIIVSPKPVASFTQDLNSGCSPLTVNFTNTSVGAASYSWDFGNSTTSLSTNPTANYVNTFTASAGYTVTMVAKSIDGCKDTANSVVTVFGTPVAAFTSNAVASCSPFTVNFTNTSVAASTYSWDFGDGSPLSSATSPSHVIQNQTLFIQNYTVTLIVQNADGCSDTTTQAIQSYPEALFTFTMVPDSGCGPVSVNFPSAAGAVLYQWDFGDGTTGTGGNPTHVYAPGSINDTSFTVELIATNAFNCVDTTSGTVVVYGKPIANFVESTNLGCPSLNVNFVNTSSGANSYIWDFGDGSATSTVPNTSHSFANTSTTAQAVYQTSLIASNAHGCSDTLIKTITVQPDVNAAFSADTPICAPVNVVFTNNSAGSNSYFWTFGDGNSSSNIAPSHQYLNAGSTPINYQVMLIATNTSTGCDDTITQSYNVYPVPNVSFTASPATQTFPSTTVTYNNTSTFINSWTYTWDYGDSNGSTLTQPGTHSYTTTGTYTITLIGTSGFCSDTTTQTITIVPPVPVADFIGSYTGCRPLTASFTNTTQFDQFVTSYLWSFGDGGTSTQTNPSYTYYNAGTYTVTLTAIGPGGTNTVIGVDSVTVHDIPVAYFVATPTTVYIPSTELTTVNLTTGGNTYVWDFGDGTQSFLFNPSHNYMAEGDYQISLIATSQFGCTDTFELPTLIHAETQSEVQVPNAFSPDPNGPSSDGIFDANSPNNDIFHPVLVGVKKYELRIYNRWGELVFQTEDMNVGWDGYYKGKLCTQDVYIWKITAETNDDKKIKKAGDVLLLR